MTAQPATATEATQELVLALLQAAGTLGAFQEEMLRTFPPRALQYARDPSDQMRTVVASGSLTSVGSTWANNNNPANWYGTGSPNSMDARESERTQTVMAFRNQRSRWTLT